MLCSMKTFKQYLDERKERPYQFACRTGKPSKAVWKAYNDKPISGVNAIDIYMATGRKVSLISLFQSGRLECRPI